MSAVSVHAPEPSTEIVAAALRARRIRRAIGGSAAVSACLAELAFGVLQQGWPAVTGSAAHG